MLTQREEIRCELRARMKEWKKKCAHHRNESKMGRKTWVRTSCRKDREAIQGSSEKARKIK